MKKEDKIGIVAICHYDTREFETVLCMERFREWALLNGYKIDWCNTRGDSIPQAREKMWLKLSDHHAKKINENDIVLDLSKAKSPYNWILYIDSDQVFEPSWLEKLLNRNVDIVGAGYPNRTKTPIPTCSYLTDGRIYPVITGMENGGLKEVDSLGFGFILIRKQVMEKLPWPWFKYEPIAPGQWVSEDTYFCTKAKQYGFKVFVDWDLDVGHCSKEIRTMESFRIFQKEVLQNSEKNLRINKEKYGLTDEQIDRILRGEDIEEVRNTLNFDAVACKSSGN